MKRKIRDRFDIDLIGSAEEEAVEEEAVEDPWEVLDKITYGEREYYPCNKFFISNGYECEHPSCI
jgi:hypothetical protein